MAKTDWDVMILHYLGLDHIGHTAGPSSPLVPPKLEEMDQIVEEIHRALLRWDQEKGVHSLLVLCGDHGMSDGGSHGGASAAETTTPLVFLSSMFAGGRGKKYNVLPDIFSPHFFQRAFFDFFTVLTVSKNIWRVGSARLWHLLYGKRNFQEDVLMLNTEKGKVLECLKCSG